MLEKTVNLAQVYKILKKVISDDNYNLSDRVALLRFQQKLSDSELFELKVNREFSAQRLKHEKDAMESKLSKREKINLSCDFTMVPSQTTNWELYWMDELFLRTLDLKIARRICYDINVAFSIKCAQMNKQ